MNKHPYIRHMNKLITTALVVLFGAYAAQAQDFETRRDQYIANALANPNGEVVCLQAYLGQPVDQGYLTAMLNAIPTLPTADFQIVKLIRILCLSNGEYDAQILPVLENIPFWLNYSDTVRGYWSENHMIMWMSSNWLLHERYGFAADAHLEQRINHYLDLKLQYGFYEFFSPVYAPYCFSGIVNLADFATDPTIKAKAIQVAQKLLAELLLLTNDQGVFYPVAGRSYYSKYYPPFGQNHNSLIHLASGLGPMPERASHAGAFLATSTLPTESVAQTWTANLDTILYIGHPLADIHTVHEGLIDADRIMFQWSGGAYFHPDVVLETAQLLADSNLWMHVDFEELRVFSNFPVEQFTSIAENLNMMSMSSVICGQEVAAFKHGPVTLSSIHNFWPGKIGYQQMPCMANLGTAAIMPASGEVTIPWDDRSSNHSNQHLPYVEQRHNVALLVYREQPKPEILGYANPEVALHWPDSLMDEIQELGNWLLGRQADGYVAVRRYCNELINGQHACPVPEAQAWAMVVGHADMYGSFTQFAQVVEQSQFTENWSTNGNGDLVYEVSLTFDTVSISHSWAMPTPEGVQALAPRHEIRVLPNPVLNGAFQVHMPAPMADATLQLFDLSGRPIYIGREYAGQVITLPGLAAGVYVVSVTDGREVYHTRLLVP